MESTVFRLRRQKERECPFDHFVIDMHKVFPLWKQTIRLVEIPGGQRSQPGDRGTIRCMLEEIRTPHISLRFEHSNDTFWMSTIENVIG